jgi:hypothetical protein
MRDFDLLNKGLFFEKILVDGKFCFLANRGHYNQKFTKDSLLELLDVVKNSIDKIDLLNELVDKRNNETNDSLKNRTWFQKKRENGIIYLIKCTSSNLYKIGRTSNQIKHRLNTIKSSNPNAVLVSCYRTNDMSNKEKKLHDYFKNNRVSGEWFDLKESDIQYFENYFNK